MVVDSIVAFVYRAETTNLGFYCSTESTGVPVEGLKISLRNADTGQLIDDDVTDVNGRFALVAPPVGTYISLEPCLKDYPPIINPAYEGLTALDAAIIQSHITKSYNLSCPLLRIAADFQFDGRLDFQDVAYVQDFVSGNNAQDYPYNPWRLVPNIYTFPTSIHPDANFTSDYWDVAYPDVTENASYYPFDAKLNLLGEELGYRTSNHWRDTVKRWQYTPSNNNCGEADYGFWLVKAGDMDGSAPLNLNQQCIGGSQSFDFFTNEPNEEEGQGRMHVNDDDAPPSSLSTIGAQSLLAGRSYRLQIKLNTQRSINAYQLGLTIDPSYLEIEQIEPVVSLAQNVKKEFNTKASELAKGNIRMLWLDRQNTNFIKASQWTDITQIRVKAKNDVSLAGDLKNLIRFNDNLLPSIFVSGTTAVSNDQVDIKFEFEAL
ncbi:MAG: carboxypeptidase-like regulatory domain-containing protein [Bacteroidota bacterium]